MSMCYTLSVLRYNCKTVRLDPRAGLYNAHEQPKSVWAFRDKSFSRVKALACKMFCVPIVDMDSGHSFHRDCNEHRARTGPSGATLRSPRLEPWGVVTY